MAANRFPLFRLPFLALCLVLDLYGISELIQLSLCSRRSLRVTKKCWKKKGEVKAVLCAERIPSIRLHYNNHHYRINISKAQDLRDKKTKFIRIGDAVVPSIHKIETVTYWDDKMFGIERTIWYIKDLFHVPIHSIVLKSEEYPNEFIRIMDFIMKKQGSVKECTLRDEDSNDECLTYLLDNCNITRNIKIRSFRRPTRQFRHDWNVHLDGLHIYYGYCFTFQNLTNIDCQSFQLFFSSLSSENMNQFLKHWQNGGNYRIKFLSIVLNSLNRETITAGIDTVLQPRGLRRIYEGEYHRKAGKVGKCGGLDIRSNDGKTGVLFFDVETLKLRMAVNRFPLFRLPFLALCLSLDFYGLNDIIQLSLCSKRSLRVTKKCWKKKGKVKAVLSVKNIPSIRLHYNRSLYRIFIPKAQDLRDEQTKIIRVGDAVVPSIHKDTLTLITYWDDKMSGIKRIVRYIKDLFDEPIHLIELRYQEYPNEFIRILDSIMSLQESVRECRFNGENSIDDCMTHLFDNCKIPGILRILGGPTSQFKHSWAINLDDLYISNGSLLAIQNLMTINCKSLELPDSSLTSEDVNQFLKHWQNGGNSRLKFLWMEMNSIDQGVVTSGINIVSQPERLFRYYEGKYKFKMFRSGGIDLRRNDGTTGTIFFYDNAFEFVGTLKLRMAANSIPIFRIPFLALRIILGRFSPVEIIQLSLCSKRSLRVAKQCWRKKGVLKAKLSAEEVLKVNLTFYDTESLYRFVILEAKDNNQQTHNIRVGDSVVPSIHKGTETVTFWKDKLIGIQQIVKYVNYLFDEPVHSIDLVTEEHPNDFIRIIDSIMLVQESIEECTLGFGVDDDIEVQNFDEFIDVFDVREPETETFDDEKNTEGSIDECLTHLLDNCKITGSLSIYEGPSSQFSHSWNVQLDSLYVLNGSSITFQKLTNINCKSLEICCSSLTNEDANQFLKHWQNGGNSRLKFLSTEMNSINQEVITLGIATVLQQRGLFRYYESMTNPNFKVGKFGGLDIRRNDGTTGTIFLNDHEFEFGVDPTEIHEDELPLD
ncbi:unnamed protein product [Caenorhabditis brenneri]